MVTYAQIEDVTASVSAGATAGAAGTIGVAVRFFGFQVTSLQDWSSGFLFVVAAVALACAVAFGMAAWLTRRETVKHESGTRVEKS